MIPKDLINREIPFKFAGVNLRFQLSLGLFSSLGVDQGSIILLKTLAQQTSLNFHTILDAGCGYGALGLSLAARIPEAYVDMQDRDALAVDFAWENARLNKLKNIKADTCLAFQNVKQNHYDLVVSNIPAKAGAPVLEKFLEYSSLAALQKTGLIAVVIVATLSDFLKEKIEDRKMPIVYEEKTKQYTIFHFRPAAIESLQESSVSETSAENISSGIPLEDYIRRDDIIEIKRKQYRLKTVYNLPDFDNAGLLWPIAYEILKKITPGKNILFWNPGQGHLPIALLRQIREEKNIILAGRDRLQLEITRLNLQDSVHNIRCISCGYQEELPALLEEELQDFIFWNLDPVPLSRWYENLKDLLLPCMKAEAYLAIGGNSSNVQFFSRKTKGLTPVEDRKKMGHRVILYRNNLPKSG